MLGNGSLKTLRLTMCRNNLSIHVIFRSLVTFYPSASPINLGEFIGLLLLLPPLRRFPSETRDLPS